MFAIQQTIQPYILQQSSLQSTGPDEFVFANAYSTVAASILSTTSQQNWTPRQLLVVEIVKILRKATQSSYNTPPPLQDTWWRTYYDTIEVILSTAQVSSIQEFCNKIHTIKTHRKNLKKLKIVHEHSLIQLLDNTHGHLDSSHLIDNTLSCLDELDSRLDFFQKTLQNCASI